MEKIWNSLSEKIAKKIVNTYPVLGGGNFLGWDGIPDSEKKEKIMYVEHVINNKVTTPLRFSKTESVDYLQREQLAIQLINMYSLANVDFTIGSSEFDHNIYSVGECEIKKCHGSFQIHNNGFAYSIDGRKSVGEIDDVLFNYLNSEWLSITNKDDRIPFAHKLYFKSTKTIDGKIIHGTPLLFMSKPRSKVEAKAILNKIEEATDSKKNQQNYHQILDSLIEDVKKNIFARKDNCDSEMKPDTKLV